jgi:hypothetical protein
MIPGEEPVSVSLLYTARLGGDLALLPRLMTRIQQVRFRSAALNFLVDLGRACLPETWICTATNGLGMLVAMDGMSYDAFHIGPQDALYARPQEVMKLRETIATPLAAGPWVATASRRGIILAFGATADFHAPQPATLHVILRQTDRPSTALETRDNRLYLMLDAGGDRQVPLLGRLDLMLMQNVRESRIMDQHELDIPTDLAPEPSITSVIEFVESEARRFENRETGRKGEG